MRSGTGHEPMSTASTAAVTVAVELVSGGGAGHPGGRESGPSDGSGWRRATRGGAAGPGAGGFTGAGVASERRAGELRRRRVRPDDLINGIFTEAANQGHDAVVSDPADYGAEGSRTARPVRARALPAAS